MITSSFYSFFHSFLLYFLANDARELLLTITLFFFYYTGAIHEYPAEQDAINFAVNNASGLNNVSIFFKRFNDIANNTLFRQGRMMRWM